MCVYVPADFKHAEKLNREKSGSSVFFQLTGQSACRRICRSSRSSDSINRMRAIWGCNLIAT